MSDMKKNKIAVQPYNANFNTIHDVFGSPAAIVWSQSQAAVSVPGRMRDRSAAPLIPHRRKARASAGLSVA